MNVIDPRRLGGIAAALAVVAGWLLASRALVAAGAPLYPIVVRNDWVAGEKMFLPYLGGQIVGVRQAGEKVGPIGVLLGSSYQTYAIDVDALEAAVRPPQKWLRLTHFGGTTTELERVGRMLMVDAGIRPKTLVITLSLKLLVRSDAYINDQLDDERFAADALKYQKASMGLQVLAARLEWFVGSGLRRLFPDRTRVSYRLMALLLRARTALLLQLAGRGPIPVYSPVKEIWVDEPRVFDHPGSIAGQIAFATGLGHFVPENYSPGNAAARSLVGLVRMAHSVGADVAIVSIPVHSSYRRLMPAEARRTLAELIAEASTSGPVRFIDLEAFAPDEWFFDLLHLNATGREHFTPKLAEELNRGRPAPAKASD